MFLHRQPPPGHGQARDHDPAVAFALRPLLHPDVHQGQLVAFRLEPEIDGILLLGLGLVVEDRIGEPAIALHAAHALHLLEHEVEVGIELRIVKHEGPILRALGEDFFNRLFDRGLVELLGGKRGACKIAKSHG
jgi:hypothetical protein